MTDVDDKRSRFEAQVMPHLDAAYRFARWLGTSPSDADDVLQEAILRAYRGFEGLRGANVKAWLLAIVRICHITAVKQEQRRGFVPLPEEWDPRDGDALVEGSPDPERAALLRDQQRTLEALISSLPQAQREVLLLREIEELDYREIASVIQMPIGTVMSRLARARAALKLSWHQACAGEIHGLL